MIRIDAWKQNLEILEADLGKALAAANRQREDLRVIVVTKTHQAAILDELMELQVRDIGESYAQEAIGKKQWLRDANRDLSAVDWHMIGHVQTRKARAVATHFDWVHSLDSLKLARRLDTAARDLEKRQEVLIQVNISGEASKHGFPAQTEGDRERLLEVVETLLHLENLDVRGLMSIPPLDENKQIARDHYAKTRELKDWLHEKISAAQLSELSMGMSNDFTEAILEGSTMIRVGKAVLGPRETKSRSMYGCIGVYAVSRVVLVGYCPRDPLLFHVPIPSGA